MKGKIAYNEKKLTSIYLKKFISLYEENQKVEKKQKKLLIK